VKHTSCRLCQRAVSYDGARAYAVPPADVINIEVRVERDSRAVRVTYPNGTTAYVHEACLLVPAALIEAECVLGRLEPLGVADLVAGLGAGQVPS
jgi:hypothetical protein